MNIFKRLSDILFKFEKLLVSIIICIMVLVLFAGVTLRYVFNNPLYWSGEVAIFSLVWVSFIGGSMGIKLHKAASVSIVTDILKERTQNIVYTIGWAIVFCFCFVLFFYSILWITSSGVGQLKSDDLQIPVYYPYSIMPLGFLSLMIHTMNNFFESLKAIKRVGG